MKPEIFIAEWVCFGAYIASMTEEGVLFHDLAPSNVGVDEESQRIVIFDVDCFDEYRFPGDLQVYATALFSFVGYMPVQYVAAFRFGYLHHGGRFGRLVFDHLRHDHGLTPWADPAQIPIIPRLDDGGWAEEHQKWMRQRQVLELPDLETGAWMFRSLLRPDRSAAVGKQLRAQDPELAFHAFERQLIVNVARNELQAFLLGITEIGGLAAELGDRLRSQVWGMTLTALSKGLHNAAGLAWPELAFWVLWTAEEEVRALGAVK